MLRMNILLFVNILLVVISSVYTGFVVEPGPTIKPTIGEVWPKPQTQQSTDDYFNLKPSAFNFQVKYYDCDILTKAIKRYQNIIDKEYKKLKVSLANRLFLHKKDYEDLKNLVIDLTNPCEDLPHEKMIEEYDLRIGLKNDTSFESQLTSSSIWGILRGLETFIQLIHPSENGPYFQIQKTNITDFPRFKHRGLLVDTSRHFISLANLYTNLDAMSYNKLNVFHWHITDDQSFPYESKMFPLLSEKGAYDPSLVYSQQDVQNIIEYAKLRGIRVIPEFDTPGHTRSWGIAYPEILTQCFENNQPNGKYGPMNPIKNSTYTFLKNLYKEINETFPDNYKHIGGDEVDKECWLSNPDIQEFMVQNNITDPEQFQTIFHEILYEIGSSLGSKLIVWEEIYAEGVNITKDVAVQVWSKSKYLNRATKDGLNAILSSCWYLSQLSNGGDWKKFYDCDPYDYVSSVKQRQYILGGEACMWGEYVDDSNILPRIWPRTSAIAEKLWSSENVNSYISAQPRLEEHTCRMKNRGIPAQPPNGAGFCI